jgi:hypothetical protein
MSRSPTTWSCWVSLAKRSRSIFSLTVVCRFLPSLSSGDAIDGHQWEVQVLSAGFRSGLYRRCRVIEEGFHLYGEMNVLGIELYASAEMLRFRKCSIF